MTKSDEVEKTLEKLREDYKTKLPEKISELNGIYKKLTKSFSQEELKNFYIKVHNLHGTAGTFGYPELGEIAAQLEKLIKQSMERSDGLIEKAADIQKLLDSLQSQAVSEEKTAVIEKPVESTSAEENKLIYLLDDDLSWDYDLSGKIQKFGYQVIKFDEVGALVSEYNKTVPAIFIININLVNTQFTDLLEKQNQNGNKKIPIIVISDSGEFSKRLQAVRLGSEVFFVKPFLIDDLVNQIDSLLKPETVSYRILIVDDEADVANYYAAILQQANMKTCVINKSSEIDRVLHEFKPDLILIDLVMPDCNGLELASIIRQQKLYQSTPIIYLSAEEDHMKQLNAMKLGADDFITKSTEPVYLIMRIKTRIERFKKVSAMMVKDNLTGLYNHSFMLSQLEIEIKKAMQTHNPLSIVLIDLDRFKKINDNYGHQAGDHVLRSLALMITKKLHANDIVGRFSGDKLLVILPNMTADYAKGLIEELRKQFLTLNYSWNQQIFNASFSAGIAAFPDFHSAAELIESAAESTAQAKKNGRNKVEVAV